MYRIQYYSNTELNLKVDRNINFCFFFPKQDVMKFNAVTLNKEVKPTRGIWQEKQYK